MQNSSVNVIPCTVGMLTWNSSDTLARTLENVLDFAEVIIADGGSTDDTLVIAEKYGARVIPQTNPGYPITDFSKERNLLLCAATQPWFLWLDSDELISDTLREEIRTICADPSPAYYAYDLRIERCDSKTLEPYIDLHPNYQMRFFSRRVDGRFINKIHERLAFDRSVYKVGKLSGAWIVPIRRLLFEKHKKIVDQRFKIIVEESPPRSMRSYIYTGVYRPTKEWIKILVRATLLRILHPFGHVVPLALERNRAYTQWVIMRESWKSFRMARSTDA